MKQSFNGRIFHQAKQMIARLNAPLSTSYGGFYYLVKITNNKKYNVMEIWWNKALMAGNFSPSETNDSQVERSSLSFLRWILLPGKNKQQQKYYVMEIWWNKALMAGFFTKRNKW